MQNWSDLVWPAKDFSHVPYPVFFDKDVYDREQERVFRGLLWCYVALKTEIPKPGDYKSTFIGDTPIVVTRTDDGSIHAFVNRCAHRGTLLVRDQFGNGKDLTCIYHHWCYDLKGELIGVPFLRGLKGKGGMPEDFKLADHGLRTLTIDSYGEVIFARSRIGPSRCSIISTVRCGTPSTGCSVGRSRCWVICASSFPVTGNSTTRT